MRTVAEIMRTDVATAAPTWSIAELERELCAKKVSGFPVVDRGQVVGVVSRADVIRQLTIEHARADAISDYFRRDDASEMARPLLEDKGFVESRLEALRVADVMSTPTFVANPEMTAAEVAQLLVENQIHRVPVTAGTRLVGIVSSLDLVRLVAERELDA